MKIAILSLFFRPNGIHGCKDKNRSELLISMTFVPSHEIVKPKSRPILEHRAQQGRRKKGGGVRAIIFA